MKILTLFTAVALLAMCTTAQATLVVTSFEGAVGVVTGLGSWGSEQTATITATAPVGAITDGLNALEIVDTGTGFHLLSKPDLDKTPLASGLYDALELDVYLESAVGDYRVLLNTAIDDVLINTGGLTAGSHHIVIPLATGFDPGAWAQLQIITNGPATGTTYIDNVHYTTVAVPEPSTFCLFALGAVAMLNRRRRS